MRYKTFTIITLYWGITGMLCAQPPNYPFPNHTTYAGDYMQPNQYTQEELDQHTASFYEEWRDSYLANDCNPEEYYIKYRSDANTVSEAHGYGMMIMVYMAGYDDNAQLYFDGLYKYYQSHPSQVNHHLMDWQQITCNDLVSSGDGSATDGDLDIAFALLLAHAQWGNGGAIDYLDQAKLILDAILKYEINPISHSILLGDWSTATNSQYYFGTRTSDFLIDHFRTFVCYSNEKAWTKVMNTCFSIISEIQEKHSSSTGLLPDFVIDVNQNPSPATAGFLEGDYDGHYYYNACRDPWRLGTDYLVSGDLRSRKAVLKINDWLRTSTGGAINKISNGYLLDGTPIYTWNDATFTAPFAVGAMLGNDQQWLNNLYDEVYQNNGIGRGDYYSHTISLLSRMTLSGNYWIPGCNISVLSKDSPANSNFTISPVPFTDSIYLRWSSKKNFKSAYASIYFIDGKLLQNISVSSPFQQIHMTSLKAGTYLLIVYASSEWFEIHKLQKL
ncbi:MAG: glycosyl hydrolase family 8 [Reichenbachiella sp.]|uniref:glycosyl hydrolase family 8 n=1 Tax=Reichenbachiella sp. TaxID=2184521 RepID=UPI003264E989